MGQPPLIVFHFLIPSKDPLIDYLTHTHATYLNMYLTSNLASHSYHIHGIISQSSNVKSHHYNIHPQIPQHIPRHGIHLHPNTHIIMEYSTIHLAFHALYNQGQQISYGSSIKQGSKIIFIQRQLTPTKHVHHIHQTYQVHYPNQMHVHAIMHDLPHLPHCSIISAPISSMYVHVIYACSYCSSKHINHNY